MEGSDEGDIDVEGSEEHFDESEHVDGFAEDSVKRSVLQTARMGPVSRWMRAREKVATVRRGVRRGVILRQRVMRKVVRMRKRVTRRCGMRCRKPYQGWGMKSMTRPLFGKVSNVATLFISIIPSVSAVLGCV